MYRPWLSTSAFTLWTEQRRVDRGRTCMMSSSQMKRLSQLAHYSKTTGELTQLYVRERHVCQFLHYLQYSSGRAESNRLNHVSKTQLLNCYLSHFPKWGRASLHYLMAWTWPGLASRCPWKNRTFLFGVKNQRNKPIYQRALSKFRLMESNHRPLLQRQS